MNASEARENLYRLLDETASDHEPVLITGRNRTLFLSAKKTGTRFRKLCIFAQCQACVNPSLKGLARRLTDV
jgi:hypothetical protein